MEYVGRKSATISRRFVELTPSAAAAGMRRSRENGVHRGGRPTAARTICAFTYGVLTGRLKPDPQGAEVEVWVQTRGIDNKKQWELRP